MNARIGWGRILLSVALLAMTTRTWAEENSAAAIDDSAQQPAAGGLPALVDQLDSNRYLDRERATQALLAAGAAALDPLLAAANSDRPEASDRAVWVLKKLGESDDRELGLAALERLVQVKNRPAVVQDATLARGRIYELRCQEALAKLGARLVVIDQISPEGMPIRMVQIELTDDWHGTATDLECLSKLSDHRYFRVQGTAVGDKEIKLFESMDSLALLQIWKTKVTPAAVDAIKDAQPKAVVYVRNRALLGIGGATHPKGVLVTESRPNTGAANAGILKDDVITSLDGEPVKDFDRLTARIAQYEPGQQIEVKLLRGDEEMT
ncbi:MAG: PDZ domain-containing protein, partial [Pirellulales bacterium]